jgi:phosphoglycolate phosphatase
MGESARQAAPPLLVLFDIDGTLLLDDGYAHGRAMVRAMREVWGVALPDDAVERVEPWGKTDLRIAREALVAAGVAPAAFDGGRDAWIGAASKAFEGEVEASADAWQIREGLSAGLDRLAERGMRLTLLTGNLKPIAAAKVRQMGLLPFLDLEIGAYGNDAEERADLVPIARRRARWGGAPWPRDRAVIVGDTPGDVAAAEAASVAALIFASDRFPAATLAGATLVVRDVPEMVRTLETWANGTP